MPNGTSIRQMNQALYNASVLMLEASKHLSSVPEFQEEAALVLVMANNMANVIQPEVRKVSEDKMLSIMDEIANFGAAK